MQAEWLLSARWLVPVEPKGVVIDHGALAIAGGSIIDVGHTADLLARHPQARRQDYPQHLLMPGLVNAHGHAAMTLLRGAGEDMALMDWLQTRIWPLEKALVSPEFVADGSELACAEMLRAGTTCYADHYFYPERAAAVVRQIGMRAVLASPVLDFPTPGAASGRDAIQKALTLNDQLRSDPRVRAAFGPHAPYTVSDDLLAHIAMLTGEVPMMVHMHVHESAHEIAESLQKYGKRPLQRLADLGLLGPQFVAVHAVHLDDNDIALLKQHDVRVVHCPESNLKLASGFCPLQKLLDAGIKVALGTDGAASNNDLDLIGEMRTAAMLAKAVAGAPTAATIDDMLWMATMGGAYALGLEDEIGSLAIGKSADVIAIDLGGLLQQPVLNPRNALVWHLPSSAVQDVWVQGQRLVKNGDLLTVNETSLRQRIEEWQARVLATLAAQEH